MYLSLQVLREHLMGKLKELDVDKAPNGNLQAIEPFLAAFEVDCRVAEFNKSEKRSLIVLQAKG